MKTLSRKLATGVLIAGVLVAGAAALAGAGNNPEVFYACKNADGAIRLVDGGAACKKDEVKVWWNSGLTAPAADASAHAPAAKPTATPTQPPASPTPTPTPGWVDPIAALQVDVSGLQARAATSRPGFSITTLDSSGGNISLAIGADGLGLISYVDSASRVVKVAHCNDTACTDAAVTTLDVDVQASSLSPKTSIAIGADGFGLIAYSAFPSSGGCLRAVHCTNASCSSFEGPFTLAATGQGNASLAIGSDGLGLIVYYGGTRVAHCNDAACTSAATRGVDGVTSLVGSIAIGADGLGFISYQDGVNDDLKVAHCNDVACTSSTRAIVDSLGDVGLHSSVAIGVDGLPLIAYTDGTNNALKIAHCSDMLCSSTTVTTLDSAGYGQIALTIGADGLPVITYAGLTDYALKAAHCSNVACTTATLATIDAAASSSSRSVAIGADGLPVVSYQDAASGALKAAHCSNRFCIPNVRPR